MRARPVALSFVFLLLMLPNQASSQAIEAEIARWVDANTEEVHALLERVVNMNSGTSNHAGVRAVGDVFVERLARIGFDAAWVEASPEVDRAGHVLAVRQGDDGAGRKVLLIGHLDTVFEDGDAFNRFVREGDIATGPGVVDDKGGIVVLLSALEALDAAGGLDRATVTVLLTGDEESVGRPLEEARRAMVEAARASDLVLSFERGFVLDGEPYVTVARRSSSGWTLTVDAKQAHSGRIFSEADGVGAINEISRIVHEFYTELAGEEFLTFNVGSIVGGTDVEYDALTQSGQTFGRTNVIPRRAVARGDLRTISQDQLHRVRAAMTEIVGRNLPQTSAEIAFRDGYPAMSPRDANYELLEEYSSASEALGLGPILPLDPGLRGAGDVAFASDHVGAALDGLGPQGGDTHGPGEWVDLTSFAPQIERAAALIFRLTH
ncbi:MAG: M20/M25/M40 family metallo-hydrolase [Longimicrobiales bacterium]